MTNMVEINGIPIANYSYKEALDSIHKMISKKQQGYIVTVNPEMVLEASHNGIFLHILKSSTFNTADGIGILWAAYYLSRPKYKSKILSFFQLVWSLKLIFIYPKAIKKVIKERITGTDLLPKIINYSQKRGWRIFFLGAAEGIAQEAISSLYNHYPKANFVGCFAGSPEVKNEKHICHYINQAKPDILFVAYGAPRQELWIYRNLKKIPSVKVAIGVGGAFDFYANKIKRAPKWMRQIGLEWLWRLFRQPSRFVRIWNATFRFIKLIMKNKH